MFIKTHVDLPRAYICWLTSLVLSILFCRSLLNITHLENSVRNHMYFGLLCLNLSIYIKLEYLFIIHLHLATKLNTWYYVRSRRGQTVMKFFVQVLRHLPSRKPCNEIYYSMLCLNLISNIKLEYMFIIHLHLARN